MARFNRSKPFSNRLNNECVGWWASVNAYDASRAAVWRVACVLWVRWGQSGWCSWHLLLTPITHIHTQANRRHITEAIGISGRSRSATIGSTNIVVYYVEIPKQQHICGCWSGFFFVFELRTLHTHSTDTETTCHATLASDTSTYIECLSPGCNIYNRPRFTWHNDRNDQSLEHGPQRP